MSSDILKYRVLDATFIFIVPEQLSHISTFIQRNIHEPVLAFIYGYDKEVVPEWTRFMLSVESLGDYLVRFALFYNIKDKHGAYKLSIDKDMFNAEHIVNASITVAQMFHYFIRELVLENVNESTDVEDYKDYIFAITFKAKELLGSIRIKINIADYLEKASEITAIYRKELRKPCRKSRSRDLLSEINNNRSRSTSPCY